MKIPFKQIYVSGCSHTAGGGLMEIREWYASRGILYEKASEVTYPSILSDTFDIPIIDTSMYGSSALKTIRESYEYIEKNGLEEARNTLFILQFNESPLRFVGWSNFLSDYFNLQIKLDNNNNPVGYMIDKWVKENIWTDEIHKKNDSMAPMIVNNLYNHDEYLKEIKRAIIGFLSYLNINKINHIFTCENLNNEDIGDVLCLHRFFANGENSIYKYALRRKLTIAHITGISKDGHPSVEAHREYANELIKYINKKYS